MSSMNEFCIEWTKDRDYATVTAPSGTALKSKLIALAEKRPEEVKRVFENVDGSVCIMCRLNISRSVLQNRFQKNRRIRQLKD